jgi:hypothetical protein
MSPTRNPDAGFTLNDNPGPTEPITRKRTRVIRVPLTDDGKLDTSKVSPETIENVRQAIGITTPEPVVEKPPVHINREFIPNIYSLLEVIIQKSGQILLKWPPDLASEMYFSPEKKEALTEPTALVLEKYAPTWLVDNQEVAALGMALTAAVNDMVTSAVTRYTAKKQAEMLIQQQPQPINGQEVRQ